jgi:hypothetical protein
MLGLYSGFGCQEQSSRPLADRIRGALSPERGLSCPQQAPPSLQAWACPGGMAQARSQPRAPSQLNRGCVLKPPPSTLLLLVPVLGFD